MRGAPINRFKVIDYAYGDPGEKVLVGQKPSQSSPDLESLGRRGRVARLAPAAGALKALSRHIFSEM